MVDISHKNCPECDTFGAAVLIAILNSSPVYHMFY